MSARVDRQSPDYEEIRRGIVWNEVVPDRFPAAIVRPAERSEVADAVGAAAAAGQRVAVKSGGHNWLGSALRDDALVLDLSQLNRVEVDAEAQRALVEPGATHKVLADAVVPHGLAFPIGHCPSVGLGGFLLSGGAGWNMHEWGPGCWNVTAADLVTAGGEEIRVDEESDPDLLWALRGGSAAFPGVITRFHLRLHELPAIRCRRVAFPVERLDQLLPWAAERLRSLPAGIEISVIARTPWDDEGAPPRATVVATGFGGDPGEAAERVEAALRDLPGADDALLDSGVEPVELNDLEGEGGWQEGLRYAADTVWISGRYEEVGRLMAEAVEVAPSPRSRIVFAFGHMPQPEPDAAFTRFGELTVNLYATWSEPDGDRANVDWVRRYMRPLDAFKDGHYIGETDLSASPFRLTEAYPKPKWERLQRIVDRHDPDRRFHGFVGHD